MIAPQVDLHLQQVHGTPVCQDSDSEEKALITEVTEPEMAKEALKCVECKYTTLECQNLYTAY